MLPGAAIGHFQLVSRLGRGGMGEVWLAEQREVGTKVAIKVLHDSADDEADVQRFFNEARAVSRIEHPGIVRIYDVGHAGERAYLIMELLEGESLAQRLRRGRPSIAQLGDICRQIASVLEATHAAGVTHRDLKPDNVFLVRDREMPQGQRVKILDFGIAKLSGTLASGSPHTTGTLGTPAYMAPEQWGDASKVDWRADLYSLGCLAFELACGRPPFIATSLADACAQHLHDAAPRVRSIVPSLPVALDDLLAALLAKKPEHRPTMRQVMTAFAVLAGDHTEALAATQPALLVAVEANAATVATLAPLLPRRRALPWGLRSRVPALVAALAGTLMAGGIAAAVSLDSAAVAPALELSAPQAVAPSVESRTRQIDPPPRAPVVATSSRPPAQVTRATRAPTPRATGIEVVMPPPDPRADLPIAPTVTEMMTVLEPLEAAVMRCGTPDSPSTIGIDLVIMPDGKLGRATPLGTQAFTDVGLCASRALIRARFPETQHGLIQTFSFKLR